jgi:hypothetical protein
MKLRWDVDDSTVVEAELGPWGKHDITVNGRNVDNTLNARKKSEAVFDIPGDRRARIVVKPQLGTTSIVELWVDGALMVPTGKNPPVCGACGTTAKPNDRFCPKCGQAMPSAEHYVHQKRLKEATQTIWALAVLFAIFGVASYFLTKSKIDPVLSTLSGMDPNDRLKPLNGVTYTVAALRAQLLWAPWTALLVNGVLALVMVLLAFWGRRAPLAAILVASATYAVVIVANAIIDPTTIAQGIYMKLIIVLFLARGIQGALALRTADG